MEREKESKIIYKGKILNLRVDKVIIDKNNKEATREIVEHEPSVAILPITKDGNFIFVKQYRYAIEKDFLEIPAGVTKKQENIEESAKRELKEETGYKAQKIINIGTYYPSCGFLTETVTIFIAYVGEKGLTDMDEDEDINIVEIAPEESLMMLDNGYIKDMKAVIAIQWYFLHKGGRLWEE